MYHSEFATDRTPRTQLAVVIYSLTRSLDKAYFAGMQTLEAVVVPTTSRVAILALSNVHFVNKPDLDDVNNL